MKQNVVFILCIVLLSCSSNVVVIKNKNEGKLRATTRLALIKENKFPLDSTTASRPPYMQVFKSGNKTFLSFLNAFNSHIYIYDNTTLRLHRTIKLFTSGNNEIRAPLGYFIKNFDSIYVYNQKDNEIVIIDDSSKVLSRISLINNHPYDDFSWTFVYPQYLPSTVSPMFMLGNELIFPGQYMGSLPDTLCGNFKFEAHIDLSTNGLAFLRRYPESLYGHGYFWENQGLYSNIYSDIGADNKMVYSFPVSHDVFIANINDEYQVSYAGSNTATGIASFKRNLSREELLLQVCKTDLYGAIKYDPYRKVYYRILRRSMPEADYKTAIKDKPVAVIIMDETFKYLGETLIGTGNIVNWDNTFVTEEGLNIEFIDENDLTESTLNFKVFTPEKI